MKRILKWVLLTVSSMYVLAFLVACSPDLPSGEDDVETFQIYLGESPSTPYTGSGTVYDGEGYIILGTITDGKLTLNLPETIAIESLESYDPGDGITVLPANIKTVGLDFDDGFYIESNDKNAIYYMKETAVATDILAYVYSDNVATITGTHLYSWYNDNKGSYSHKWDVSLRSGWNTLWVHMDGTFDDYKEATIKNELAGIPSDLKWVCY